MITGSVRCLQRYVPHDVVCRHKIISYLSTKHFSTCKKEMTSKVAVKTNEAPLPIGPYSQAIKIGQTVYLSGQIPVDPKSGQLIEGSIVEKAQQVFKNLQAVAKASGGSLSDMVKLTIFITDFDNFAAINEVMTTFFKEPFPARSTVAVKALPLNVPLEIEGIMVINK